MAVFVLGARPLADKPRSIESGGYSLLLQSFSTSLPVPRRKGSLLPEGNRLVCISAARILGACSRSLTIGDVL